MRTRRKWTKEEDDFLRNNFGLTNADLSKKLKVTHREVRRRFADLNIDRPAGRKLLDIARFTFLREQLRELVPEEWFLCLA